MRLPASVRAEFRRQGGRGGRARGRSLSANARRAIAVEAAIRRWVRARVGTPAFASLGFPAGDLVDQGLRDWTAARETEESLLLCLAWTRLKREGVPVPAHRWPNPEGRLYRLL